MKKMNFPYCNAALTIPDDVGPDVTCPSCGQSFFCEEDPSAAETQTTSAPPPPRRRPPRAPQAAFMQRTPGGTFKKPATPNTNLENSIRFALIWLACTLGPSILFFLLWEILGGSFFFLLGWLCASIFPIVCYVLGLAYLRTIALNSER